MFLVIFLYSSATADIYCDDNPNLCTVLFRADLFIWTLIFLAIINSPNRASRLDWLFSLVNFVGICLLGWNFNVWRIPYCHLLCSLDSLLSTELQWSLVKMRRFSWLDR
jgi:hypothetical protein